MWRDEIQAWLIARDSAGIADLVWNLRHEGHPPLWHIILMPLTRLSDDPRLMHLPVILCMAAAVALVLWRAPFTPVEKLLFPFGYFILFEYGVKSRSYAVGVLLLTVFCCLWRYRRSRPILPALALVLLAQVHVLFAILAAAGVLAIVAARLQEDGGRLSRPSRAEVLAALVFIAGWLAAIALPAHAAIVGGAAAMPRSLWSRLGEIASVSGLFGPSQTVLTAVPALAVTGAAIYALKGHRAAQIFLLTALAGLIAVFMAVYGSNSWHRGLVFLTFLAGLWLAREPGPSPAVAEVNRPLALLALVVMGAQAFGGLPALWNDMRQPLSKAAETAAYIRSMGWDRDPLVGISDDATSAVVGQLGIARAYYANSDRWGSFVIWDRTRLVPRSAEQMMADIAAVPTPHTLLAAPGFAPGLVAAAGYREVARFTGAADRLENFVVWRKP